MHIDLEQAEKAIAAARKEAVKLQTKSVSPWSIPAPICGPSSAWTTPG